MLFPNGVTTYITGGLLIGLGVSLIFIFTGLRAGASSFFTTTWSYLSRNPFFHSKQYLKDRGWRIIFTLGIVLGALIYTIFTNTWFTTQVSWYRLLIGGILVGIGTRTSRGCTSGHGICGLAAGVKPSLIAVITFIVVAVITALTIQALGVTP